MGVNRERAEVAEVRVMGQVVLAADISVGEIAAASPGYLNLAAYSFGMFENEHRTAPLSRLHGTQKPRSTGPDDDNIGVHSPTPASDAGT